jgi:hypothetical protein
MNWSNEDLVLLANAAQRTAKAPRMNQNWPCGHKRTPSNTKLKSNNRAICRKCEIERQREWRRKRSIKKLLEQGMCQHCAEMVVADNPWRKHRTRQEQQGRRGRENRTKEAAWEQTTL